MMSIGDYEARRDFSKLLGQVARGKRILITRCGQPVALLIPPPEEPRNDTKQVVAQMKALRRGNRLGPRLSIRDLIKAGRRF